MIDVGFDAARFRLREEANGKVGLEAVVRHGGPSHSVEG